MTPLELEILMHYYCKAGDYRDGDFRAPAVREAIDQFLRFEGGALLVESNRPGQTYAASQRAIFYIEHLLEQPLPIQVWVIPTPRLENKT